MASNGASQLCPSVSSSCADPADRRAGQEHAGSCFRLSSRLTPQTFVTALVLQLIIAGVYLLAFVLLRKRVRKVYEPRTYLPDPRNRVEPVPPGILGWLPHVIRHSTRPILVNNGMDAYMFIRFRASAVSLAKLTPQSG